jgi:hypothetical protein
MIDQKLINEALQRWARTPDGRVFYVGLQKLLMGVPSGDDFGALRENLGRRRFASELMAVMAEVMSEIETSDDPRSRPIVFTLAQPVAGTRGVRGARRRVAPAEPESGAD